MGRTHSRNPARAREVRFYRRPVTCPACGWRLIDTCARDPVDLMVFREGAELPWEPDFVTRCRRCKNEVGIRKSHHEAGCRSISVTNSRT